MNKENIFSFATLTITYIYTYRIHFGFVCFHIIFTTFTFVYLVHSFITESGWHVHNVLWVINAMIKIIDKTPAVLCKPTLHTALIIFTKLSIKFNTVCLNAYNMLYAFVLFGNVQCGHNWHRHFKTKQILRTTGWNIRPAWKWPLSQQ